MNVMRSGLRFFATGSCGAAAIAVLFLGLSEMTQSDGAEWHYIPVHPVKFEFHPPREELKTTRNPKPIRADVKKPELLEPITSGACDACSGGGLPIERISFSPPPPGPRVGPTPLVAGSDVDVQPIVRILPDYPPNGRGDGWGLVQFDVTKLGTVANARVVDASPRGVFEKNALKAIERWRYRPAVMEGQAVERRGLRVRLSFVLERA